MGDSVFYITTKNNHYDNEENTDWPDRAARKKMGLYQGKYDC